MELLPDDKLTLAYDAFENERRHWSLLLGDVKGEYRASRFAQPRYGRPVDLAEEPVHVITEHGLTAEAAIVWFQRIRGVAAMRAALTTMTNSGYSLTKMEKQS